MNLTRSSTDFGAVRDGRDTKPFYIDIDLTNARSDAANTAQMFEIAGNSVYIDANPMDGTAQIEFQDSSGDITGVPFYVSPGFIAKIGFTRIRVTNAAQSGKKIRLIYSTDADFQPGSVAQVAITGALGIPTYTASQSRATIAATSTALVSANATRKYLKVVNNSAVAITLNEAGGTAVVGQGMIIGAGGWFEWNASVPTNAMTAISASGSNVLEVIEGN